MGVIYIDVTYLTPRGYLGVRLSRSVVKEVAYMTDYSCCRSLYFYIHT
jgi:hypothetical protein